MDETKPESKSEKATPMKNRIPILAVAFLMGVAPLRADDNDRHRVEGKIPFSYDYAETLERAKADGKPILAYFTFET